MGETARKTTRTQATTASTAVSGQPPQTRKIDLKPNVQPELEVTAVTKPTESPTPQPPRQVELSPSRGVQLNATVVAKAFTDWTSSRSVRFIQYALHERGFTPDNDRGAVTFDTRAKYAEFQRSIDEQPTGIPTPFSLEVLGFDVIG